MERTIDKDFTGEILLYLFQFYSLSLDLVFEVFFSVLTSVSS